MLTNVYVCFFVKFNIPVLYLSLHAKKKLQGQKNYRAANFELQQIICISRPQADEHLYLVWDH